MPEWLYVVVTGIVAVASVITTHYFERWRRTTIPTVVEEYRLEEVGKEGFRKVVVKFLDTRGRLTKYEFHPAHLHAFSDESVRYAARAMRPVEEAAPETQRG